MLDRFGNMPAGELHVKAVRYVRAAGQAEAFRIISPRLSEKETDIYKRGRNANTTKAPKNAKLSDYRTATGVEALFGWLWLTGEQNRAAELFDSIVRGIADEQN